jgi:archaemetzincin
VVMAVGILPIGQVDPTIQLRVKEGLVKVFPETSCSIVGKQLPLSERDFDKNRKQYRSNIILNTLQGYAAKRKDYTHVLGIVDADIFVPELNFVFGEAACPGKAALISLWRLKPEFYQNPSNMELFATRSVKEAVHEIGHTLGLRHCQRSSCVMHFSNSIFDTDKKQTLFCDECYLQAVLAINSLEKTL